MRPSSARPILIAIDGEPHTEAAIRRALSLGAETGARVVAVHVKDTYLKQFAGEIYAQGREEYLEHVEGCLASLASEATEHFSAVAREFRVTHEMKVLEGDPLPVLAREVGSGGYSMVVVGRKHTSRLGAWRSRDLPRRLAAAVEGPLVMVVPQGR